MNKRPLRLLPLLLAASAAASPATPVRAVWKRYSLDDGRYRGYNCAHAEQAARDILELTSARNVRTRCYWSSGLAADWESLAPVANAMPNAMPKGTRNDDPAGQGAAPVSTGTPSAPKPEQSELKRPLGELLRKTGATDAQAELARASSAPLPEPSGESIELAAVWMRAQLQRHMSGGGACNAYSDIYDALLARIPTREVQYTVFCNQGSGYIQLAFDYLAPQNAPTSPGAAR